ncbi:hypothetical protein B0T20DRAFT_495357 [Sordaria brevicollis]|uniref:F-box domain-containing protein n=1 Tax=Sordaria brevicollis TaxID=83679 RepID=A0AAE0PJR1_SORBR|nr:hypothetical protein B0T20DRAFT_495357 [Sordaria brevicollis]
MVETRRGKVKRAALEKADCLTEAQPQRSPIIRLPFEIRLKIYKEVWTPTREPWEYDEQAQRSAQPCRDRMKQIHILTSVCRHFRDEVIREYFHRTQAHIAHCVGGFGPSSDERILASMKLIKASILFTDNLQHVRLNWFPEKRDPSWTCWAVCLLDNPVEVRAAQDVFFESQRMRLPFGILTPKPGKKLRQADTFKWLASLKNLKTLQINFVDVVHDEAGTPLFFGSNAPLYPLPAPLAYAASAYPKQEWRALLKLPRKLEVIDFRLLSVRAQVIGQVWKDLPKFREYEEELVKNLLKDPNTYIRYGQENRLHDRIHLDIHVGHVRREDRPSPAI